MARPGLLTVLKKTAAEFVEDECPRMAAALSYYVVFSLPSLLVLVLLVAGAVWGADAAEGELSAQIESLMGGEAAAALREMLEQGEDPASGRGIAALLGFAALAFGATGAFIELQNALNRAWNVAPDPEAGGLRNFVTKRLLSIGMVLSIAFLLLVSLALSAMLSAFGGTLATMLPGDVSTWALRGLDLGLSLAVITLLFAAMYRVLPDARIAWRDVWVGAAATTVLFLVGKFGIGFYLGQSSPGEAFGAAGALAVLLVWIYYSAMIFLFGAEFTQVWANTRGQGVEPEEGAVLVGEDANASAADREAAAVAEAELHPSRPAAGTGD